MENIKDKTGRVGKSLLSGQNIFIIIFAILAVLSFVAKGFVEDTKILESEINKNTEIHENNEKLIKGLSEWNSKRDQLDGYAKILDSTLPLTDKDLITTMETMSLQSGATLVNMGAAEEKKVAGVSSKTNKSSGKKNVSKIEAGTVNYSLDVTGSYPQTVDFIQNLGKAQRAVVIKNISMVDQTEFIRTTIMLRAYYASSEQVDTKTNQQNK